MSALWLAIKLLVVIQLAARFNSVEACWGATPYPSNQVLLTNPSNAFVRCIVSGSAQCYNGTSCPTGAMLPFKTFPSFSECQSYTAYVICRDSATTTYSCNDDYLGCTGTSSLYTTTVYLKKTECQNALPTKYVRCLGRNGSPNARFCYLGFSIPASCQSDQALQPPSQTPFSTLQDCLNFDSRIRCYRKTDESFNCRSDLSGCNFDETQSTNSMSATDCNSYSILYYVRCVTVATAATKCRIGDRASFIFSNANLPVATAPVNPLSNGCNVGESASPSNAFTDFNTCNTYARYTECYNFDLNTGTTYVAPTCVLDTSCLTTEKKSVLNAAQLSTSNTCGFATSPWAASAWVRCTLSTTVTCRPVEAGCYTVKSEVATVISPLDFTTRTFTSTTTCQAYPAVAGKWLRCKSATNGSPYCYYQQCKDGDARLVVTGTTPDFPDFFTCSANLFWAKACYSATQVPDTSSVYYSLIATYDTEGATCTGSTILIDIFVSGSSSFAVQASLNSTYISSQIPHSRCGQIINSTPAKVIPVCRPDMAPGTTALDCVPLKEFTLPSTASSTFNTYLECNSQRFYAKSCYTAYATDQSTTNAGTFYSIKDLLDTDGITSSADAIPVCANFDDGDNSGNDLTSILNPPWITDSNENTIRSRARNYYTPTLGFEHRRCQLTTTPVCRPTYAATIGTNNLATPPVPIDGCAGATAETRLTRTTPNQWSNLQSCLAVLYAAKPCYVPNITPPTYYTLKPLFDTDTILTCEDPKFKPVEARQVGDLTVPFYYAATTSALTSVLLNAYLSAQNYHVRCGVNGVPVCRPNWGTNPPAVFAGSCPTLPIVEVKLPGGSAAPYSNIQNCLNELYYAAPCYRAWVNLGAPYYQIVAAYDTTLPTAYTCASTDAILPRGGVPAFVSTFGKTTTAVDSAVTAWYTAPTTTIQHWRCKTATTTATQVVVCRPDMRDVTKSTSAGPINPCASGEILLPSQFQNSLDTPFPDLAQCTAGAFFAAMCYDAKATDPSAYECVADTASCTSSTAVKVKYYGGAIDLATAIALCKSDNTAIWSRCELSTKTGYVCRISKTQGVAYGCLTTAPDNEIQLAPTSQDVKLSECKAFVAYINCYDKMSTNNLVRAGSASVTPMNCKRDYIFCTSTEVQMVPSLTTSTFTDTTGCGDFNPVNGFIRCVRTNVYNGLNLGLLVCRPAEALTCTSITGTNQIIETQVGTTVFANTDQCLQTPGPAFCRCKDSTNAITCAQYTQTVTGAINAGNPVAVMSCCGAGKTQLPNAGTFYDTQAHCLAGSFT